MSYQNPTPPPYGSPDPYGPPPVPAGPPQEIQIARIILWVQGGLGALGLLLSLGALQYLGLLGGYATILILMLLLSVAVTAGVLYAAATILQGRKMTMQLIIAAEAVMILTQLYNLFSPVSTNILFSLIGLGAAGAVIAFVTRPVGRAFFVNN